MALRLQSTDTHPHTCTAKVFDKGEWREIRFTAYYHVLSKERQAEVLAARDEDTDADSALLDEVLDRWDDLHDLDGNAIPHNPENRAAIYDAVQYSRALVRGYFESLDGPAKNSRKRRGS